MQSGSGGLGGCIAVPRKIQLVEGLRYFVG